MPSCVIFDLTALQDSSISRTHGAWLYSAFLSFMQGIDPDLSQKMHDNDTDDTPRLRPFTLSMLYGELEEDGNLFKILVGNKVSFRVTGMDDEIMFFLRNLKISNPLNKMTVDNCLFDIAAIHKTPGICPEAITETYQELVSKYIMLDKNKISNLPNRINFLFSSPTCFRDGHRFIPLPVPEKIFNGLVEKWESFSPISLKDECGDNLRDLVFAIAGNMTVGRFNIRSRVCDFGRYRVPGFIGECELYFHPEKGLPHSKAVLMKQFMHVLADYSLYAGVGYHTTMGMGQVRIIS